MSIYHLNNVLDSGMPLSKKINEMKWRKKMEEKLELSKSALDAVVSTLLELEAKEEGERKNGSSDDGSAAA